MNIFGRSGSGRRLPPSDTELRMRCIEASTRLVTEQGLGEKESPKVAAQALMVAQAYYAFVKGRHMNSTLLQTITDQNGTAAPPNKAIGVSET